LIVKKKKRGVESRLFRLNWAVDFLDEEIAGIKSDWSSQSEKAKGHDDGASKIEEDGDKFVDLEFGEEVEDGIEEHIECWRSRSQERSPPPIIIFTAQLEVAHDNRDLGAGQNQNDKDDRKEAKNVIKLVQPDGRQDEEQLNEDGPERKDSSHQDREQRPHIPNLLGDLARDLVGSDFDFLSRFFKSEIASKEHQGDGDSEPQGNQSNERHKRNSSRALFKGKHAIQNQEDCENTSGEQKGGQKHVFFPVLSLE